jgi:integrase
MISEGLEQFSELDAAHIAQFTRVVRHRRGYAGPTLSPTALRHYYGILVALYRHRRSVSDAIQVDPFPGLTALAATPWRTYKTKATLYTPDEVAIPLIQGAIEFLTVTALPTLAARERCVQAYNHARGVLKADPRSARIAAFATIETTYIDTPRGPCSLADRSALCRLIDLLYAACFVLISYLVGPRVSELMNLQAGCIQTLEELGSQDSAGVAAIVGAIYKGESYHGRPHRWVAPSPAIHAVTVLEALSAPHRARSGRGDLWQRPRVRHFGLSEWLPDTRMLLRISDTRRANARVNRFARWLQIPRYKGRHWWFTSHQGRKSFARFVALRDGTALYALAQHLGHRNVRQTDGAYAGTDYELDHEIEAAVLEQSVDAWEQMLSSKHLGGRMGADVLTRRPRFRGGRIKQAIRSYARMLAESGLTLGVCEWGYCVYREEFSACRGGPSAPNPVRREPSTCARCKNFCLSDAHRPYWTEQLDRYREILNDPELPAQTLKIARARLDEARALIKSLDSK